jgi:hypothetical protein
MSRPATHLLWILCLFAGAVPFLDGGCRKKAPPATISRQDMIAERADALRQALVTWFECEECTNRELEAVVAFGPPAVPSLAATLRQGPSPAMLEKARGHLQETYQQLKAYERTHPQNKVTQDEAGYVSVYLENFDALYRVRAAKALGAIGGPDAKQALAQAKDLKLREDVARAAQAALQSAK